MDEQAFLTDAELASGLDNFARELPHVPVLLLEDDLDVVASRHGLVLQASHADLGPLRFALVKAGPLEFTVERYEDNPAPGTTLCLKDADVNQVSIDALVALFALSDATIAWRFPADALVRRAVDQR
jgi:hypothetical protein